MIEGLCCLSFKSCPYPEALKLIANIEFTNREIDVISLICNGYSKSKDIAIQLYNYEEIAKAVVPKRIITITEKAVDTHIANILRKIGPKFPERGDIKTFALETAADDSLRAHFYRMMLENIFLSKLKDVSSICREKKIKCIIDLEKANTQTKEFYRDLIHNLKMHLGIAAIEVEDEEDDYAETVILTTENSEKDYSSEAKVIELRQQISYYHFVFNILSKVLYQYDLTKITEDFQKSYDAFKNGDSIYCEPSPELLIDKAFKQKLSKVRELYNKKQVAYYCDLDAPSFKELSLHLALANIILTNDKKNTTNLITKTEILDIKLEKIKEGDYYVNVLEFVNELLGNPKLDNIIEEFEDKRKMIEKSRKDLHQTTLSFIKYFPKGILFLIICVVLPIASTFYYNQRFTDNHKRQLIHVITLELFTTSNLRLQELQGNREKFLQLVHDYCELRNILQLQDLSQKQLVYYLYNLCAISNQYNYHEHNGEKAREILIYAKNFAESYVSSINKIPINFHSLSNSEIYSELIIVKDLAQIYTKIAYLLGRTYIYHGDKKDGVKYFELANYLGGRLNLFEEYLSIYNGLNIICLYEIEQYLQNKDYKRARDRLLSLYKIYSKRDFSEYQREYKPRQTSQDIIIPARDSYNQIMPAEKIIKICSKLILISDNQNEQQMYLRQIKRQLEGFDDFPGMLAKYVDLSGRKLASVYNTIGNMLLDLYEKNIDVELLTKVIGKKLNLENFNHIKIAEYMFNKATSDSRDTDFTKADSYDGLIRVYNWQIKSGALTVAKKQELSEQIPLLYEKRDKINSLLYRQGNF
jgi:hypothetical protein